MLAQDKYQAVTNEIEEIQEVRKKVDDMRVKFEKIKEKIENNWSGGIAYSTNLLRTAWLKERERNETGVLKKRIVEVKAYEHPGANNWNGIIKGRKPGISVNISIPNGAYIMQEDNNMAMLIENEGGDFYLIPRIEAERESSKQEQ